MTRKDFEAIATMIAKHDPTSSFVEELTDYFAETNPRFNIVTFMKAINRERNKHVVSNNL